MIQILGWVSVPLSLRRRVRARSFGTALSAGHSIDKKKWCLIRELRDPVSLTRHKAKNECASVARNLALGLYAKWSLS